MDRGGKERGRWCVWPSGDSWGQYQPTLCHPLPGFPNAPVPLSSVLGLLQLPSGIQFPGGIFFLGPGKVAVCPPLCLDAALLCESNLEELYAEAHEAWITVSIQGDQARITVSIEKTNADKGEESVTR